MNDSTHISIRVTNAELRHLKKLARQDGSISQALRNLIHASMGKNNNTNTDLYSAKTYFLLKQFIEENYEDSTDNIFVAEELAHAVIEEEC